MIGLINLEVKCAGARSAGNPHAACDVEGVGNGATCATAPALDPTTITFFLYCQADPMFFMLSVIV